MKTKRLIAIILTLVFSSQMVVMAEKTEPKYKFEYGQKEYGMLMLMQELGYVDSIDNAELEKPVTRGKFAKWLSITANITDERSLHSFSFKDVHITSGYYEDIQRAVSRNYMQGNEKNAFRPSDVVTQQEAVFALLNLAGYESYATIKGGFPKGYLSSASSLGILDGTVPNMDTYNVLNMIFNTFNTRYLSADGIAGTKLIYTGEKTVLEHFHDIYDIEGRMTANSHTQLYTSELVADKKSCEIDKEKYIMQGDFNDLIGMTVRGWYKVDTETEEKSIVSLYANDKYNKIFELDSKDFVNVDGNCNLYYSDEYNRSKRVKLIRGFDFIYNNRIVLDVTLDDFNLTNGGFKLIDYNCDGEYDTVIATETQTMRVKGVDYYSQRIYTDTSVVELAGGSGAEMKISVKNADGTFKEVTVDGLEQEQVITVYASKDLGYVEVLATAEATCGFVEEINLEEEYVVVGGVKYEVARADAYDSIILNADIDIYLDVYGRIAYATMIGGSPKFEYAYLFNVKYDYDVDMAKAKLITASGPNDFFVSKKVMIDGDRAQVSGVLALGRQMIRYRTNKKGEIMAIDTPTSVTYDSRNDILTSTTLTNKSILIGPQIIDYKYKITPETFMLQVPSVLAERDNIDLYSNTANFSDVPQDIYNFEIFDIDPEDMTIGAYIYYPSSSLATAETLGANAAVGVVDKVMQRWEDGENVTVIRMFVGGKSVEYIVDETVTNVNFDFGDIVRYKINTLGKAILTPELDVSRTGGASATTIVNGGDGKFTVDFGRIISRQKGYLVLLNGNNNSGYTDPATYEKRKIISTQKVNNCVLVDMSERKISVGESKYYSQYISGTSSPSYVYAKMVYYENAILLVIYNF